MAIFHKTWHVNPASGILEYVNTNAERPIHDDNDDDDYMMEMMDTDPQRHITIWHRDMVAANCILIKGTFRLTYYKHDDTHCFFLGHCDLFGLPLPQTLQRPSRTNRPAASAVIN